MANKPNTNFMSNWIFIKTKVRGKLVNENGINLLLYHDKSEKEQKTEKEKGESQFIIWSLGGR